MRLEPDLRDSPFLTKTSPDAMASRSHSEIERLRSLLRKAMPGASMVEIAPGEVIGLYQRPDEA